MTTYFSRIDALLDQVEDIVRRQHKHRGLPPGEVTRWRWDAPDLQIRWQEEGTHLGKTVQVAVTDEGKFSVEANAWLDIDDAIQGRKRRYVHASVTDGVDLPGLVEATDRAFAVASAWTSKDLSMVAVVPANSA